MPETENPATPDPIGGAVSELVRMNSQSLHFLFKVQRAFFDEMIDTHNDIRERVCDELGVAKEFASKISEAHSVNGIKEVYESCGRHQMDSFRRETERLFKHGQRFLDRTSKVFLESGSAELSS